MRLANIKRKRKSGIYLLLEKETGAALANNDSTIDDAEVLATRVITDEGKGIAIGLLDGATATDDCGVGGMDGSLDGGLDGLDVGDLGVEVES